MTTEAEARADLSPVRAASSQTMGGAVTSTQRSFTTLSEIGQEAVPRGEEIDPNIHVGASCHGVRVFARPFDARRIGPLSLPLRQTARALPGEGGVAFGIARAPDDAQRPRRRPSDSRSDGGRRDDRRCGASHERRGTLGPGAAPSTRQRASIPSSACHRVQGRASATWRHRSGASPSEAQRPATPAHDATRPSVFLQWDARTATSDARTRLGQASSR